MFRFKKKKVNILTRSWQNLWYKCNNTRCQWGYNHVFLCDIPQVFVSQASRLLTAKGIALHFLCIWSPWRWGRRWVWNPCRQLWGRDVFEASFICRRSVWNGRTQSFWHLRPSAASVWQLTNVDSTLTTEPPGCANNFFPIGFPLPIYGQQKNKTKLSFIPSTCAV